MVFLVLYGLGQAIDQFRYRWIDYYNPSNLFARARLVKARHVAEYSPAKTGEYPRLL